MNFLTKLKAGIQTYRNRKQYKKANDLGKLIAVSAALNFGTNDNTDIDVPYPFHDKRKQEFIDAIEKYPINQKILTVNFGDSLTDLTREWITSEIDLCCACGGMWAQHIARMAEEMAPYILARNMPKYVVVGTLGGNPLLVYERYAFVKQLSIDALNRIRKIYPTSKIIVYGLPPTYNLHAIQYNYQFDIDVYDWIKSDGNAVIIELKDMGQGFMGLMARTKYSADGIHFTPNGAIKFVGKIEKAKKAIPGSIVY